jgi:hypothetical protein
MIDEETARIARDRLLIEIDEQASQILQDIERIKREVMKAGKLRSGETVRRVSDICVDAIKIRAQIAWQVYFRFLTTAGITYAETLSEELKSLVAEHIPEPLGEIKGYVKQIVGQIGMPHLFDHFAPELDAARRTALAKVGTEIDLFVQSLKRKQQTSSNSDASTVFNFYSPVGSIQTGDYAVSNASQNIDTEVKERLLDSLDKISKQLASDEVRLSQPKEEVVCLIEESRLEIENTRPNMTKLRGTLSAIADSIQTVASMAPAYETLKRALAFFGVTLP